MSATTYNSPSPPAHLFVYGTLKQGESRYHMLERGKIKSIAKASVPGELIDLGEYPALRLDGYAKQRVHGDLIEFEALDEIIAELDAEEGSEFRREVVNVTREDGGSQFAWIYVLANDSVASKSLGTGLQKAKAAGYQ